MDEPPYTVDNYIEDKKQAKILQAHAGLQGTA